MAKKAYIGVANFVPRALPSGYTQVEYIESDGAQYIDSGVNGKSGLEVYAKWMYTNASYKRAIIGCLGNDVRTYPMHHSASNYGHAYQSWVASNLVMEINTVYNLYTKLYSGEQIVQVNGETVATGSKTGEYDCGCPMYIFALYNEGSASNQSSARLYDMQIYDNGTLVRDYVPCTNSAGVAGLYDMANGVFYQNAGTGTFTVGASTHTSVARKIKKGYIGVDGKARQIKKAYIGIGGVARPCWSGGELAYYGTVTSLKSAVEDLAATTVGNYALFGGGCISGTTGTRTVNAYNKSLTRSNTVALQAEQYMLGATTVGNYAIFAGGLYDGNMIFYATAFDTSLTTKNATSLSYGTCCAATTVGNYALFAGGTTGTKKSELNAYNASLTYSKSKTLSTARGVVAATTVGSYAIFAGGISSDVADAFNSSLTRTIPAVLSAARYNIGATAVGNYALFAGGGGSTTVDVYDKNLTKSVATSLSVGRGRMGATTIGNLALFGGGGPDFGSTYYNTVDVYDESLTRTTTASLSLPRADLRATTIGKYALFGGGYTGSKSAVVDAYVFD